MSVDIAVENVVLKRKLADYERKLKEQETDPLTQLYSKQKFFSEVRKMLDANPHKPFIFIRFDIERFQLINSFFGLDEGDKLLQYLAFKMRQFALVLPNCIIGRIEGDIFGMCYNFNSSPESLRAMMMQNLESFIGGYRADYELRIIIGAYPIEDNSMSIESIYSRVILASKKCKQNPTGGYLAFYDASMSEDMIKNQRITNQMSTALKENQFEVVLQPKCHLKTGELIGAEALVRWRHPENGYLPPSEFIPVFEKNGFIFKLDEYVWNKACEYIRSWIDSGFDLVPISVNVSRYDLRSSSLPAKFKEILERYNVPAKYLHLEITESSYAEDANAIVQEVQRLKDVGLHIEMDDFGTAYSSLNMLNEMPIDTLKLDMSFVRNYEKSPGRAIILQFIVKLAQALNLEVLAEGVETKEQAEHLLSLGCCMGQGYYFSKPVPKKDFDVFVMQHVTASA
ncbi:GGDEF domain-containing phosphodiesterase [Treponema sp. HNW]|uniref:putative bifunctional diguanylate cyclase/phosphodiesterase n=1 Tax=Treponema sp. HNW TaxID=3116654 RepID=UPI003D144599